MTHGIGSQARAYKAPVAPSMWLENSEKRVMSVLPHNCPPSYASIVPAPDYTSVPVAGEELVELALRPPPYLTRTSTSTSHLASSVDIEQPANPPSTIRSAEPVNATPKSSNREQRFVSRVGSIELDLGPRNENTTPSFGLNGRVHGDVRIKKLSHVQSITLVLEGRAQVTAMQSGFPSAYAEQKLLHLPLTLYSTHSENGKEKAISSRTFPFEFTFPTHCNIDNVKNEEPARLPPTFHGSHPGADGSVRYRIRLHVVKSTFWPDETLVMTVNYLPKSYSLPETLLWPAISIMDAKRFGLENSKWKTTTALLLPSPHRHSLKEPSLLVSIPSTARAVANFCFQVNVTLRLPGFSSEDIDALIANPKRLAIQMLRKTTMNVNGQRSTKTVVLGLARCQQVEKELVQRCDERIVRGWFAAGTPRGETSWSAGDLIENKYFIRVVVTLWDDSTPIFKHEEPITMFTHSRTEFEDPSEVHDAPAINLLLASSVESHRQR